MMLRLEMIRTACSLVLLVLVVGIGLYSGPTQIFNVGGSAINLFTSFAKILLLDGCLRCDSVRLFEGLGRIGTTFPRNCIYHGMLIDASLWLLQAFVGLH